MAAPPVHDLDVHMDFEDVKRKQLGVKCTLTVLQWAGMVASAPTAQMKSAQLLLFLRREVNFLVRGTHVLFHEDSDGTVKPALPDHARVIHMPQLMMLIFIMVSITLALIGWQ